MKNIKSKILSLFYAGSAMILGSSNALAINFGKDQINDNIKGDTQSVDVTIQTLITRVMVFI